MLNRSLHKEYVSTTFTLELIYKYVLYTLSHNFIPEINKNLKIKKGVGIAIKSKETSSKLAI